MINCFLSEVFYLEVCLSLAGLHVVPECVLNVGGETCRWEHGQCLVFDDSFLHSVTHQGQRGSHNTSSLLNKDTRHSLDTETNSTRAVLIVDLWHPALNLEERNLIDKLFAPVKPLL